MVDLLTRKAKKIINSLYKIDERDLVPSPNKEIVI